MQIEQFELLETRIYDAIKLIEHLRNENETLKGSIAKLQSEMESRKELIQQLKEENQNLKHTRIEIPQSQEKEDKIKSKIEQMLAKLDELQYL